MQIPSAASGHLSTVPAFPIEEYEQLQSIIWILSNLATALSYALVANTPEFKQALQDLLNPLQERHATLSADLDERTRPKLAAVPGNIAASRPRRGFEYRGTIIPGRTRCEIYVRLLRTLWAYFPDRRETMAAAMAKNGRTRCYVATTPEALFPGHSDRFATSNSKKIVDGWYADVTQDQKWRNKILRSAVGAVGLQWGKDVKVHWEPTVMPTN